jgi:hypothetical protein
MWDCWRKANLAAEKAKSINAFGNPSRVEPSGLWRRSGHRDVSLAKTGVGRGTFLPLGRPARGAIIGQGFWGRMLEIAARC